MVGRGASRRRAGYARPDIQLALATGLAALALAWQATRVPFFADLWLTPDQQGRRAAEARHWKEAAERFEDPSWKGVAAYRGGLYDASAQAFGRVATAEGFFNRGDAQMKAGDYRQAIKSFELAVDEKPDWVEARENLALARYTSEYIERMREQSGTEGKLGADEIVFDNEEKRGEQTEITRKSTIALESAEKWMRAVDTETRDFLRTRFLLEESFREEAP